MDKWEVPKLILAKKVNLSVIYLGFWPISIFDNMESRDCYSLTWFCGALKINLRTDKAPPPPLKALQIDTL